MSKPLGINKDLEPLAREVRRRGGTVEITGSTHVRWTLPCGTVVHSGLTMSGLSAKVHERKLRALLDPTVKTHRVEPADKAGKYRIVDEATGKIVCNDNGYPRTFSSEGDAHAEARRRNNRKDTP